MRDGELHGAQFGDARDEGESSYLHVLRQQSSRVGEPVALGSVTSKDDFKACLALPVAPLPLGDVVGKVWGTSERPDRSDDTVALVDDARRHHVSSLRSSNCLALPSLLALSR